MLYSYILLVSPSSLGSPFPFSALEFVAPPCPDPRVVLLPASCFSSGSLPQPRPSPSLPRAERELQAACSQVDAGITEITRLQELPRQSEETLAAHRRAATEHEERISTLRQRRQPEEADVQAAIARVRQVIEDGLQAAQERKSSG